MGCVAVPLHVKAFDRITCAYVLMSNVACSSGINIVDGSHTHEYDRERGGNGAQKLHIGARALDALCEHVRYFFHLFVLRTVAKHIWHL